MQVFRPMREIGVSSSVPSFDSRPVSHIIAVMSQASSEGVKSVARKLCRTSSMVDLGLTPLHAF